MTEPEVPKVRISRDPAAYAGFPGRRHEWSITVVTDQPSTDDGYGVVAVCRKCGAIRRSTTGSDSIDLGGECAA